MDAKLAKISYSPQGYWKGVSAIKKLADAAKVPENVVKQWLYKQAIWQIYLPAPRYVPRPKFDLSTPNSVHQADLLFLPHDKLRRKTYKYALTVVDIASRYKEAEPLTSKDSNDVARAFQAIYRRGPLTWPSMLQVDPGHEFMGGVTKEMDKHKTYIRRSRAEIHRDQAIVERFNRSLAERLFGHQYAVEIMGVARIFQRGGHTDSYIGYSPNCHLNIVGRLLTKRLTKGGVTGTPGPPPPGYAHG